MERVTLDGVELAYDVTGTGEPLVLIHAATLADGFYPIAVEPAIADRFRVVRYHRRGYGASSRVKPPFTTADQAADARALLRHLGISRVHVAGHSYGAAVVLQWASDAPEEVQSLTLLEAPLFHAVPSGPGFWKRVASLQAVYDSGDREGALDALLRGVVGPSYRDDAERKLPPGAFERAVADVDSLFQVELSALKEWRFSETDARRIRQPVLLVKGAGAAPMFHESHELLREWIPSAEELVVQTTHGLVYEDPAAIAEGMAAFLSKHGM
jgi:pimeloyl-ACP methyl ester carboxylesterase